MIGRSSSTDGFVFEPQQDRPVFPRTQSDNDLPRKRARHHQGQIQHCDACQDPWHGLYLDVAPDRDETLGDPNSANRDLRYYQDLLSTAKPGTLPPFLAPEIADGMSQLPSEVRAARSAVAALRTVFDRGSFLFNASGFGFCRDLWNSDQLVLLADNRQVQYPSKQEMQNPMTGISIFYWLGFTLETLRWTTYIAKASPDPHDTSIYIRSGRQSLCRFGLDLLTTCDNSVAASQTCPALHDCHDTVLGQHQFERKRILQAGRSDDRAVSRKVSWVWHASKGDSMYIKLFTQHHVER